MKKLSLVLLSLSSLALSGCASFKPEEPLVTMTARFPSSEIQAGVDFNMKNIGFTLVDANERILTYRMPCSNVPDQNTFTCGLVMMNIGNSGWDGPYLYTTISTFEVNGVTNISSNVQWCAINMAGKMNCMKLGNDVANELTRRIASMWGAE